MNSSCEVSVLCITYNQKTYIEEALNSILSQQVDFQYEIIIHDDCSTDGTYDIALNYQKNYPDKIRVIRSDSNKYSQGIDFISPIIRNIANGKYIAVCEGDDYWIDDNKMKIQYDALEAHENCDMCACWGCTITEDGGKEVSQIRPREGDGVLSIEETILGGGRYLVTAGLFFKRSMYDDMYGLDSLDYSWQMRGALRGGIYYIDRKMAVYRRYAKGSWTNAVLKNDDKIKVQWEKEIRLLNNFDKRTNGKYHQIITERIKAYTPFEKQLGYNKESVLDTIGKLKTPVYIWGRGRRGTGLEKFLKANNVSVAGICDAVNDEVGLRDEFGNTIFNTDEVLEKAATIIASTRFAYNDLCRLNLKCNIIDFQVFMPLG